MPEDTKPRLPSTLFPRRAFQPRRFSARAPLYLVLGLIPVLAVGAITYSLGFRAAAEDLRADARKRIQTYADALTSELQRYGYLPSVIALSETVKAAVKQENDPATIAAADRFLEGANEKAGTAAIYVMDATGLTVAASNWNQAVSFVGGNFAYRPYFREALKGKPGRFYGIGTTSGIAGLFFSQPIVEQGKIVGVAAAKVNLDKVTVPWQASPDPVLVADDNGVIFLTSVPAWRFRTLGHLSAEARILIRRTRQYSVSGGLQQLGFHSVGGADGAELYSLPKAVAKQAGLAPEDEYMLTRHTIAATGWIILSLSDINPAQAWAFHSALAGSAIAALLEVLALFVAQRRRTMSERRDARRALEDAYGELENRVFVRTKALERLNKSLLREVEDRQRAETALRQTMEELVQAGKMAALGQMATGIAHELNQPLTALHTLSDNAVVLLEKQRLAEARENLTKISRIVGRMARITGELKSFARKAPEVWQPAYGSEAIEGAVSLLQQRLKTDRIDLNIHVPDEELPLSCDELRLQQVILNLLVNAADELTHVERRVIDVSLEFDAPTAEPRLARLSVADSGRGIEPRVADRLFEPFFTTKPQGVGLGLGLTIAQRILRDVGGTIRALNRPEGGTLFEITLSVAEETPSHGP